MRIGVDIGGTKLEAAAMNAGGELLLRRRTATPRGNYEAVVEAIAELVLSVEAELDQECSLGFGIPGTISPATGLVKNAFNSPFNGHPLDKDLAARFGRPVKLMNDANCFALSEARDGAGAGHAVVFGAILGTGCGSGIVIDGNVLDGRNAVAGEWGHNPLPWADGTDRPGLPCDCGKIGCIETYISGTGLSRQHAEQTEQTLPAVQIVENAQNGCTEALRSLACYEDRLARALASIINVIDPDVIVLGGGMSNVERLYANVPALWANWVFSDRVDTPLRPPLYGDSSGVRGAAWLWESPAR